MGAVELMYLPLWDKVCIFNSTFWSVLRSQKSDYNEKKFFAAQWMPDPSWANQSLSYKNLGLGLRDSCESMAALEKKMMQNWSL